MPGLNKIMLIGRLGRDPELRFTQSGKPVCNFSVATDESYVDRDGNRVDKVEWHDIVMWDRAAENAANMLRKGALIYIEGKMQTREWQDQQGNTRKNKEVLAAVWQFLEPKNSNRAPAHDDQNAPPPSRQQGAQGQQARQGQPRQQGQQSATRPPQQRQQGAPQGRSAPQQQEEDLGPAFPSDASGMDDVPF